MHVSHQPHPRLLLLPAYFTTVISFMPMQFWNDFLNINVTMQDMYTMNNDNDLPTCIPFCWWETWIQQNNIICSLFRALVIMIILKIIVVINEFQSDCLNRILLLVAVHWLCIMVELQCVALWKVIRQKCNRTK